MSVVTLSKEEFVLVIIHTALFMNFLWRQDLVSFLAWIGCIVAIGCGAIIGIRRKARKECDGCESDH